jgi:hypothetical protein
VRQALAHVLELDRPSRSHSPKCVTRCKGLTVKSSTTTSGVGVGQLMPGVGTPTSRPFACSSSGRNQTMRSCSNIVGGTSVK